MDPSQRTTRSTRTRSQKEIQSPLQSLDNGTPRRQRRAAPARAKRTKKSNASTATDGTDAQTQQPQLDSTTQATTSPSQSPQPESHSEQDVVPESRSTSPPEQQKPTRSMRALRSRSPQNSNANGTEDMPKISGKKSKAAAKSKAKAVSKGPSTHQGVGTSKARGGKRGYTHTAEDEDADAEDAGDERRPAKRNKSHALEVQPETRKRKGVHNHIESSDDDAESAADIRPTKRSRINTEAASSVVHTPGRQSPSSLSSFRANYQTTVLKPSPTNVFSSMDANLFNSSPAVGPFPQTGSPIPNQSTIFSSFAVSKQESPILPSTADTPSRKPSTLVPESTQITPAAAEGPSRKPKSDIFNEDSNSSTLRNDTPSRKLIAEEVSGYQSPRLDSSPLNLPQVAHPNTSSHISHDRSLENSPATKTHVHESNEASSGTTAVILASSVPAPFTFPVKDRLPPKPAMRNSSVLIPAHLSTSRFQESDIETDDDSFSLYKDDDLDVETKERLKAQNAQTCKVLKENMQRIKLVKKNFEQKAEEALQEASRTGVLDLSFAASSQPSKKPKSKQTPKPIPLLIFPASDSLERIEVTDPYLIGMLRAIHDYIVTDGAQTSIPDASKIAALLDSTSKQAPQNLLNGQKAVDQLENGAISFHESDHGSGNESDGSEDASASYADRADDDTTITSGMGEVTPIPTTPAKAGWLSSLKNAVLTPFSFKGKASTADIPQAEFTYSHTNPIPEHASAIRSGRKASSTTRAPRSARPRRIQPARVKSNRAKPQQTPTDSENGANKADEFAAMTSKGRAQARQDRSNEPHDEVHKPHSSTFSVPEYSDDEGETEVDVDITLAAPSESDQAAAAPTTTLATYLPPLQLRLHPGDPVPTIPAGRGYTIKYYDANGKRITHACYNATGGRLYGFSDNPNDPTYVEDSDSEDEDEGEDQLIENDKYATNTTSQESIAKEAAELPASAAQKSDETPAETAQEQAESTSILQPRQWNQTPPPKPRPGNAQLPAQPPAQQPVNKYVPKKPSGLRYVEAMSPIQSKEEGANSEARMQALKEGKMSIEDYVGSFDDELSLWAKEPRIAEAVIMAEMCPPHIMAAVNQVS